MDYARYLPTSLSDRDFSKNYFTIAWKSYSTKADAVSPSPRRFFRTFSSVTAYLITFTGVFFLLSCTNKSVNNSTLSASAVCKVIENQRSTLNLEPTGVSDTGVCSYSTVDNNLTVTVSGKGSADLDNGDLPNNIPEGEQHKTSESYAGWNVENISIIPKDPDNPDLSCNSLIYTADWSLSVLSLHECGPEKVTIHTLLDHLN